MSEQTKITEWKRIVKEIRDESWRICEGCRPNGPVEYTRIFHAADELYEEIKDCEETITERLKP